MCLAIPSKVLSINKEENSAEVETLGVKRVVSLDLLGEPVEVGEYLLIHVGYAMGKIDEKSALESLEVYRQLAEASMEADFPITPEELVTADGPLLYKPPIEEMEKEIEEGKKEGSISSNSPQKKG
ncbi:MAG: HypC/HybG/HupF family hydrogenase formation chaperone [Epsilonproteobacteria bacterium]|jgi:hydrogenase expression/formation protein HypC|nr:HypC/HybG/HupF family hydrogenase formation chaperone [Campylobacterota bacterium]NPA89206.1 HypC/HybG/HupF family hydrogenase formation chaperone [Campylobacterota bacterium]